MTRVADLQIGVFQPFRLLLGDAPHDKLGHRPRWNGLVPAACWYCSQAAAVDGSCPSLSLSGRTPDPSRSRARYRRSCHKPPRRNRVGLSQLLWARVCSSWSSGLIDHQGISRGALIQGLQASLLSLKPNKCARFSVNCHVVERWELALIFNMKNSIDVELLL
ncbi:hypothetical protein ASA_3584 [Aeromonas salmonicida subsp. salmonicida A449]|uniref:Uncharacterized protein n=1 Tax=Aeromonas salmonicida (strain A449) TaxID=382245 RepID=A4SRM9_AERS4|nr:hypothetical protein ASA_3584 [Aeromonas salmonicida subsp. salmonicida A449]